MGTLVTLLLSNVLVEKEGAFLAFCTCWALFDVVVIVTAWQHSPVRFYESLLSVLLTLAGFAVILFLGTMFFGLLNQVRNSYFRIFRASNDDVREEESACGTKKAFYRQRKFWLAARLFAALCVLFLILNPLLKHKHIASVSLPGEMKTPVWFPGALRRT